MVNIGLMLGGIIIKLKCGGLCGGRLLGRFNCGRCMVEVILGLSAG